MITPPKVLHGLGLKQYFIGQAFIDPQHGIVTILSQLSPMMKTKAEVYLTNMEK